MLPDERSSFVNGIKKQGQSKKIAVLFQPAGRESPAENRSSLSRPSLLSSSAERRIIGLKSTDVAGQPVYNGRRKTC